MLDLPHRSDNEWNVFHRDTADIIFIGVPPRGQAAASATVIPKVLPLLPSPGNHADSRAYESLKYPEDLFAPGCRIHSKPPE